MDSVTWIRVAWALSRAGHKVAFIVGQLAVDRSTVYANACKHRWLRGIKRWGLVEFEERYKNAKKGHRHRQTSRYIEDRVLAIRKAHHECCGEKIVYWLGREGITLSRSTVYRILNKHLRLRKKWRRNISRGHLPQAQGPREAIQMDTIDFGGVFAFTAIDLFTREAQVVLRPGLTAQDGALALEQFMGYFGHCQTIQTDGGSEFEGEFAQLVPTFADHHRVARPYKKNEQAFIERFNLTVRTECLGWAKYSSFWLFSLQREVDLWLYYYHFVRPSMAFVPMRPPLSPESHLI